MYRWHFRLPHKDDLKRAGFEQYFELFKKLLMYTAGDVFEALQWMMSNVEGDQEYGIGDFIEDLKKKGYLSENKSEIPVLPTSKLEKELRNSALDEVFQQVKKSRGGEHNTIQTGFGKELHEGVRSYEFGDSFQHLDIPSTLRNSYINHGIDQFDIAEKDLMIWERTASTHVSTVLMIDISHSMILYGEDRITPARKVAMALAELITTRYPKDTLDIIAFGDDAKRIRIHDLPYLQVGPYHTNTVAGIEMAMGILKKKKSPNKQILMITDGKPSCMKLGKRLYKNSVGLDPKIIKRTISLARRCRKQNIPITTFCIAEDPYLREFIKVFTETNDGAAYYSDLDELGSYIISDFRHHRNN